MRPAGVLPQSRTRPRPAATTDQMRRPHPPLWLRMILTWGGPFAVQAGGEPTAPGSGT